VPAIRGESKEQSLVLCLAGIQGSMEDNKEFQVPNAKRSNNLSMKQFAET